LGSTSNAQSPIIVQKEVSIKEYAYELAFSKYGWGKAERKCLGVMWGKEAAWDFTAISPSDDYGIPQRHMRKNSPEEIAEFMSSPKIQIKWGLNYIEKRYGSPCEAWKFWQENRWY